MAGCRRRRRGGQPPARLRDHRPRPDRVRGRPAGGRGDGGGGPEASGTTGFAGGRRATGPANRRPGGPPPRTRLGRRLPRSSPVRNGFVWRWRRWWPATRRRRWRASATWPGRRRSPTGGSSPGAWPPGGRGDDVEARANWDRLDPDRSASRIARALLAATDGPPGGVAAVSAKTEKLERWAFGESLLGPIRELGEASAQGLWTEAIRRLGSLRVALRRSDPSLAERLTQAMLSPLMREAMELGYREGQALLKQFTKVAEPLPIDPRWDRFWALVWEGPRDTSKKPSRSGGSISTTSSPCRRSGPRNAPGTGADPDPHRRGIRRHRRRRVRPGRALLPPGQPGSRTDFAAGPSPVWKKA